MSWLVLAALTVLTLWEVTCRLLDFLMSLGEVLMELALVATIVYWCRWFGRRIAHRINENFGGGDWL